MARWLWAVLGVVCAAVATAGAILIWHAPDLTLVVLVLVLPAAYVAITALFVAVSGKLQPDGSPLAWFLWPW